MPPLVVWQNFFGICIFYKNKYVFAFWASYVSIKQRKQALLKNEAFPVRF